MKHARGIRTGSLELRPLEHEDIESLRVWRNDASNSAFIRQIGHITPEAQQRWFESYLDNPMEIAFAIVEDGVLRGSVSLYDFSDATAEFGKLMVGAGKGRGVGGAAAVACARIAFEQMDLRELTACVAVDNTPALIIYVRMGFVIEGRRHNSELGFDEFLIRLDRHRFEALQSLEQGER